MSMTFTKLATSITESTVWCAPDRVRIVWITMLAMADKRGRVWGSIPGLANRARVPVDDARTAIASFLAPDPDSRTKDFEGRRIEEIDGGWRLVNHAKYRDARDVEDRRLQNREAQARRRAKVKAESQPEISQVSQKSAQAEAEAEKRLSRRPTVIAHPTRKRAAPPTGFRANVLTLYNEKLASIDSPLRPRRAEVLSLKRRRLIDAFRGFALSRARHLDGVYPAEMPDDAVVADYTARYFDRAAGDDFIAGRGARGNGHERWRADLDYLLSERCFAKVIEQ